MVDIVLTDAIISITDLKKNPMQVQELFPAVCVLNRNKPAFYCVSPDRYEELLEIENDVRLNESIAEISASKRIRVEFGEDGDLHPVGEVKMREEFEKLPEIAELLIEAQFDEQTGEYVSYWSYKSGYLNGAWYAYQEQQKKIGVKDELKELYRKEVDFLRNQTSKAILALYSKNKEDALNILKESIKG